ncbi:unnamed protein product [Linum tenue]|uniref:Uncharacterized protein n=1 Tax=Linum tenue TaxID=586396 RepID=A0AAV0PRH1_9ROSI|nr:unnamed protein product [Linum tenue]
MQEVAGERGGYLHGRGALDSDDLLYLKEQMEAEEDAERLLRRTEKRAFAAFKISFCGKTTATLADTTPATVPLPLRVEPKPKSGIRQQDLLKKVVEVKPKRPRVSSNHGSEDLKHEKCRETKEEESDVSTSFKSDCESSKQTKLEAEGNPVKSLLGLAYESSDEEED